MFWAQFTAILRALASNASCMKAGLSQSSAVGSHQTWIITITVAGIILKMPGINEYLFWQHIWIASDVVLCPCRPLYQLAVFQRSIEKQSSLESLQPAGTIRRLPINYTISQNVVEAKAKTASMEYNMPCHTYSTNNSSQKYCCWLVSSEPYKPAKAEQHCLLHKCMQEHRRQIIQEAHCCSSNHVHHRAFCILQLHPA